MLLLCLFNLVGQPHPFGSDGFFLNTFVVRGPKLNNWSPILLQGGPDANPSYSWPKRERKKKSRLSFKPMGNKPMNQSFISQVTYKSFPSQKSLKNYVYLCIYILSMNRAAFILSTWWNLVLWKAQALVHYVGQGGRQACRGKLGDTPNIMGKANTTK
jgi:hypothetical protein